MTNIDDARAAFEKWWYEAEKAAYAAGRRKGLEEAASETMDMAGYLHKSAYANAIRALIEKEPT
jgi:hypothetical protein